MRLLAPTTDSNLLARLHAQCFPNPWSAESISALLVESGCFALACEDGLVLVRVVGTESELLGLGVTPAARRRGTGSALLREALKQAARRGATAMFLEVAETNSPALALYKRHNFAPVGRRKGYYALPGSPPQDALVLKAEIPPVPMGNSVQLG